MHNHNNSRSRLPPLRIHPQAQQEQGQMQLLDQQQQQQQVEMPPGAPFTGGMPAPPMDPYAKPAEPLPFGQAFMGGY